MTKELLPGRIYFLLLLAVNLNTFYDLLREMMNPALPLAVPLWQAAADIALTAVALTGVFAYAFRVPLGFAALWRCWAFVQFAWDFYANILPSYAYPSASLYRLFFILLLLPQYIMLYRLGSRWDGLFPGEAK